MFNPQIAALEPSSQPTAIFILNDTIYDQLRAYFRSHNQRLAQLCDRDFGWD
ncbi:hypothetical protein QUA46_18830 [Microcoleus sp. MON2_D6]|uniref:hypothetical protein n=1 Tax=unclassified Microcoleus TaxID=2642155 RepID=UPI002FD34E60